MPARSICVYCSSSNAVDGLYVESARQLGDAIARRGPSLVYGGTDIGLMGAVSRAARAGGAQVVGVIPEVIHGMGLAAEEIDELIVTADLRDRKKTMEARADAFVVLPGGFGTLEELLEIITLRQLLLHEKPIVLLNVNGFWDPLIELFEELYRAKFSKAAYRDAYSVAANPEQALDLAEIEAKTLPDKWF